jgi:hypothetical protein
MLDPGVSGDSRPPMMAQRITLTYQDELTPELRRYIAALMDGRITGHRCPECGRVFVPGKGFCPLCMTPTTERDEVEVGDHGVVTGFTVITPVAYPGQHQTEPFVYASVRLDGASSVLAGMEAGQDIIGIPHDQIRAGLRVRAVWKEPAERSMDDITSRGWGCLAGVISGFTPTGEADADPAGYRGSLV